MLAEIVNTLAQKRRALLCGYAATFVVYTVLEAYCSRWPTEVLQWCLGKGFSLSCNSSGMPQLLASIGLFIGMQAAFLWGGGRISDHIVEHQSWRNAPAILLSALLLAINALAIFLTFIPWANRFEGVRSQAYPGLLRVEPALLGFAISFALASFCLFRKFHNLSRRAALAGLVRILLLTSWVTFSIALPTSVVEEAFDAGALFSLSSMSLEFALDMLLFCAGISIYLLRPRNIGLIHSLDQTQEVKGAPYIRSARNMALLLLALTYFGMQQAVSRTSSLTQMMDCRKAFSLDLAREYLESSADIQKCKHAEAKSAEPARVFTWLGKQLPEEFPCEIPWANSIKLNVVTKRVENVFGGAETTFDVLEVEVLEYGDSGPWYSQLDSSQFAESKKSLDDVAAVAIRNAVMPEKNEDFTSLYFRTENELLRRQVSLPSSGLSFPVGQVTWICLIVTIAMVPLIDDRIRIVLRDPRLGRGETWLVFDAEGRIARLVASVWLVALFLGPWLMSIMVIRMASLEVRFDFASQLSNESLLYVLLVVLTGGGSLLSFVAINDIIHLRRLQRMPAADGRSMSYF